MEIKVVVELVVGEVEGGIGMVENGDEMVMLIIGKEEEFGEERGCRGLVGLPPARSRRRGSASARGRRRPSGEERGREKGEKEKRKRKRKKKEKESEGEVSEGDGY